MATVASNVRMLSVQNQRFAFVLLCLARFMVVLDASIVNVALPSMQHDFGFSPATLQWVVSVYSLTFGSFLLLSGRVGDLFGRRRLLVGGLAIFSLASLLGGLMPSGAGFIVMRGIQGFGAALVAPTALSLITVTFEEGPARNRAFGVAGSISSLGFAAGALLGGLLIAGPGWRWVMFVNVPVGLLLIILAPVVLPETSTHTEHQHIDVLGALLVTSSLVVLVYLLAQGNNLGWISGAGLALLAFFVIFFVAFVLVERRTTTPLVRFGIFRLRSLTGGNLVCFLSVAAFAPLIFILTLYMQQVLQYSPISAGLSFLPLALVLMLVSNFVSRQVARVGVIWFMVPGLLIFMFGLLLFARISVGGTFVNTLLPGMLVCAVGTGCFFPVIFITATSGVVPEEQGMASGLVNTTQQVGGSIGLAIISTVIGARSAAVVQAGGSNAQTALVTGFQAGIFTCAAFVFIAVVVAFVALHEHRTPGTLTHPVSAEHCQCERPFAFAFRRHHAQQANEN